MLSAAASSSTAPARRIDSHHQAYDRVHGIMACERLFDIEQEPQSIRDRYGPTLFGRQALAARRLIEAGVPFVRVGRAWWDSHGQNFETHQELVPGAGSRDVHAARRSGAARPVARHAGHHARRVRPHAEHQLAAGPRPFRDAPGAARCPAAASAAARSMAAPIATATASPRARSTRPGCSRRSTGRWASTTRRITTSVAPGAADRPRHAADPRGAGVGSGETQHGTRNRWASPTLRGADHARQPTA